MGADDANPGGALLFLFLGLLFLILDAAWIWSFFFFFFVFFWIGVEFGWLNGGTHLRGITRHRRRTSLGYFLEGWDTLYPGTRLPTLPFKLYIV
jgi:hypothetical protein